MQFQIKSQQIIWNFLNCFSSSSGKHICKINQENFERKKRIIKSRRHMGKKKNQKQKKIERLKADPCTMKFQYGNLRCKDGISKQWGKMDYSINDVETNGYS